MAQAPHVPTEETIKTAKQFASVGVPTKLIAANIGISEETLFKYYKDAMESARAKNLDAVANSLFNQALSGNVTAAIFIMKTQGRWREVEREKDQATLDQEAKDKQVPDLLKQIVDKLPD